MGRKNVFEGEVRNMYYLTNGKCYIDISDTGGIVKVKDIKKAHMFSELSKVNYILKSTPSKTKGYYVCDSTNHKIEICKKKAKQRRKQYSSNVRKLIYANAQGKCALCGRSILYKDMTLDHIKPLSMGGKDCVENLQCSCYGCNQFKSNILPEEFIQRITDIFLYQLGKTKGNEMKWKVISEILKE